MLGHELRNPLGTLTNAVAVLERLPGDETDAPRGRDHRAPDRAPRPAGGRPPRRGPRDLGQDRAAARGRWSCTPSRAAASTPSPRPAAPSGTPSLLEGAPVHVDGDPARLEQVLNNLLDNALKYTPGAGRVTVTTERGRRDGGAARARHRPGHPHRSARARVRSLRAGVAEPGPLARRPRARAGAREAPGGAARRLGRGVERGARPGQRVHGAAARGRGAGRRRARRAGAAAGPGAGPARAGRRGQPGRAPEPAPAAGDGRPRGRDLARTGPSGLAKLRRLPARRGPDRPGPARHGRLRGGARGARSGRRRARSVSSR